VTRATRFALLAAGPVALAGLWVLAYEFRLLNRTLLPGLRETFAHLGELVWSGNILPDLGETLQRMSAGYALAAVAGVAGGLVLGYSARLYTAFEIPLDFFRSLPVTTLYPLFVLLFGIGSTSKIAMVAAACVFVIALNTAYGVLHRKPLRGQVAQLYGATRWQLFREVIFWEALPQILIGLRVALSYALIVAIVCEMFMGTQRGLGQRVFEAYNTYSVVELYAIVLLVGFTGYGLNKGFGLCERLVHWVGR
jgi:ABC-type nitrate/sulfonate/bicarbonate transport system permease component